MPWSYDPSQLSTSTLYQVRAEIQDTDPNDPQLLDEEISYAITVERNMWAAAARCCEMISRKFLRRADPKMGRNMQIVYTTMAKQYVAMASTLRAKSMGTVVPYVGGMNMTDKQTIGTDSSLVAPAFTRDMMENPWVGGYNSDSVGPESGADDDFEDEVL